MQGKTVCAEENPAPVSGGIVKQLTERIGTDALRFLLYCDQWCSWVCFTNWILSFGHKLLKVSFVMIFY